MARKSSTSSGEAPRVFLYKGKDDARKQKALDELVSKMIDPSFGDWDMEMLDGDSTTAEKLAASVTAPPFASPKRVVVVRHANKINSVEQESIAKFLPKVPESTCLVFVVSAPDLVDGKPRKGSEVTADLSRAISRVGEVKDFGALKAADAEAFVLEEMARLGKKADRTVANLLVRRAGTDTSVLSTEIEKLINYTEGRQKISAEDVNAVTVETPEEKVFALVDAISNKNEALALQHLDEVFSSGGRADSDAPRMLVLIARQLRLLWQFMFIREMGFDPRNPIALPEEIANALPSEPSLMDVAKRQSWLMDKLGRQVRNFERADLERGFKMVMGADASLKGIDGKIEDPKTIMELLVLGLCRRSKKI